MDLLLILSLAIGLSIVVYVGSSLYSPRFQNKITNSCIFIIILLVEIAFNFGGPPKYSVIFTFLYFIALIFLLFNMPIVSGILTSFVLLFFIITAEFISMLTMNLIFDLNSLAAYSTILYFISLLLSNIIFFVLSTLYVMVKKKITFINTFKYPWLILVVLIPTLFILIALPDYFYLVDNNKAIMFTIISLMLSNIITVFLFYKFQINQNIEMKLKDEEKKKEELKNQIALYGQYYQNHFNLLHALLHHYSNMKNNIINQEYDLLDQELEDLSKSVFNEFNSIYSESYTLNILITNHLQSLKDHNIQVCTKLKFTNFQFLDPTDEFKLFKELLDLGIQSCQSYSSSVIYIISERHYSQIVFQFIYPALTNEIEKITGNKIINRILTRNHILPSFDFNKETQTMKITFLFQIG